MERLCGEVLRQAPGHPDALHLMGVARLEAGDVAEALALIGRAHAGSPRDAAILENLGLAHLAARNYREAEDLLRRALALRPAHGLLHMRLGLALGSQGRLDEAAAALEQAARLAPGEPDVQLNLGNALAAQGETDRALACYRSVLALRPRHPAAHFNIGTLCRQIGRLDEARAALENALAAAPDDPDAHINLGMVCEDQGRMEEAASCYRRALKADPDHAHALKNLGGVLAVQGKLDEAVAAYERAVRLKPDYYEALSELAYHRQRLCAWDGIESLWERIRREAIGGHPGITPAVLSFTTSPQEQLAWAKAWAQHKLAPYERARRRLAFDFSGRAPRGRLRVGYLSADYRRHPTSYLIAELFELHDRGRLEVIAYSLGPDDGSAVRERIQGGCDRFVDLARASHFDAAGRIHADEVDILVDLLGYAEGNRAPIMALRPAPVQASWLGYPGTMGADCVDYLIADPFIIPDGMERFYAEQVVRLPDCYQVNDRKREVDERTPGREQCGLPEAGFVFCCFNQTYKILPEVFAAWMRIVKAVPGSVLWLFEANRWAADNLRRAAAAHGVAAERVVFAPPRPLPEHLARYRLADLALDTFPYTSHTTASDALWAGCPLLTRAGATFASRVAGSILINAGMRELVTEDPRDYERLAIELASSPARLSELRRRLREARDSCPLFDTPRFARNLEHAYEKMFAAYRGFCRP